MVFFATRGLLGPSGTNAGDIDVGEVPMYQDKNGIDRESGDIIPSHFPEVPEIFKEPGDIPGYLEEPTCT